MTADETHSIKYRDAIDKCYGIAGMTIGLLVANAEKYIVEISLDRDNLESVTFSPDFYFVESPAVSAKTSWKAEIQRFKIVTSMAIGNLLCRTMVNRNVAMTPSMLSQLHDVLIAEGDELCQLQKDETDEIFNQYFSHFSRLFRMQQVREVSHEIARLLGENKTLQRSEILEFLESL